MNLCQYFSIPLGYLLGSIPAAFIIGKLIGKTDIRSEGDGKISASAINRRLGLLPFLLVVGIDVGKGLLTIYLAEIISNDNRIIVMLAGLAAVVGHNWPLFLKFKGGLGATVTWGVLAAMAFLQLIVAFIPGLLYMFKTKKSGRATGIIIAVLTLIFIVQKILYIRGLITWDTPYYLIPYPLIIIIFMVIKRCQTKKISGENLDS